MFEHSLYHNLRGYILARWIQCLLFVQCGSTGTAKKLKNKVWLHLCWTLFRGQIHLQHIVRRDFPWILYLPRISYIAFKYSPWRSSQKRLAPFLLSFNLFHLLCVRKVIILEKANSVYSCQNYLPLTLFNRIRLTSIVDF